MVGRLVEDEEIGVRKRHERERNASPLAATEGADLALDFIATEAERTETILHLPSAPQRTLILDCIEPGGANVIPGRVVLTLELRDLDLRTIDTLFGDIEASGRRIAEETGTVFAATPTLTNNPSPTHPAVQRAVAGAAEELGLRWHAMPSGAGHDAQNMATIAPAGMIFVPSVNGISHSPAELTEDRDVINGTNVLLGALLALDRTAS